MIEAITDWVKGIIFVVLFASFVELLLPSNSMQKFIRVILGLFIMLAILRPVIGVLERTWTQDQLPVFSKLGNNNLTDTAILNSATIAAGKREQLARDMYSRDLARQVRATVLAIDGVADARVSLEFEESSQQESKIAGRIKNMLILIKYAATSKERQVARIEIKPGGLTEKEPARLPQEVVEKVKRSVAELYQS